MRRATWRRSLCESPKLIARSSSGPENKNSLSNNTELSTVRPGAGLGGTYSSGSPGGTCSGMNQQVNKNVCCGLFCEGYDDCLKETSKLYALGGPTTAHAICRRTAARRGMSRSSVSRRPQANCIGNAAAADRMSVRCIASATAASSAPNSSAGRAHEAGVPDFAVIASRHCSCHAALLEGQTRKSSLARNRAPRRARGVVPTVGPRGCDPSPTLPAQACIAFANP